MDVQAIYDAEYAPLYEQMFIRHPQWRLKHDHNVAVIGELLPRDGSWLDTCCGQAWHFTRFPDVVERVGLDVSAAQLRRARAANPGVEFIRADVATHEFVDGRAFDLVTNFWGAYSYLDDEARIAALVRRLVDWVAPGGALYLELITPASLAAYNAIGFAAGSDSATRLRSDDGVKWAYHDPGGEHVLTSPPVAFFTELLSDAFESVEADTVVRTLAQLVARGRR